MYAAIHPDGLVIFSRDSLFNTRSGPTVNPADVVANGSRKAVRGPPGVVVVPADPWWIKLAETESPPTRNHNPTDGETMIDWVNRVRVIKVANETTKAFQTTTKPPAFAVHQPATPKPKTKYPFIDIPEYDENAVIYNYRSYQQIQSGVQDESDPYLDNKNLH